VPIHSCINIATQAPDTESGGGVGWTVCMKKAMMQRLAMVATGIFVVVVIILLERFIGVDIIDEKKLIQDIGAELLPKLANTRTTTLAPPTNASDN
jgi:hypothetical protein